MDTMGTACSLIFFREHKNVLHINGIHQIWPHLEDSIFTLRIMKFTILVKAFLLYITINICKLNAVCDSGANL
jgi:hypothetical protein